MLWFAAGCSSKPKTTADAKPVSGTDEQIFLGDTIEKNYDPNVIMKRGEAFFDKEEFAEAIVEYQHFLELHRAHQLAVYAQLRLAESHLRMAKSIDRDPEPIQRPSPRLKNCGRISPAASMKRRRSSVLPIATTGSLRRTCSSVSFTIVEPPIWQPRIDSIRL